MRISLYSLSFKKAFAQGDLDVFRFLSLCRQWGVDGASLHLQDLESTEAAYLKRVRRAYLDQGLSISLLSVSTGFGQPEERHEAEFQKARTAMRAALLLGAPLLRVFAGQPASEEDRPRAFTRAAAAIRKLCAEAEREGMPIGLQNHNHGALCGTGDDVLRFFKAVDHPNLTFVLDTGQFAGSAGADGSPPSARPPTAYLDSIRQTASLARYVRTKFYNPRRDGTEPFIDYRQVLDILRGVHYAGFLDVVYEPGKGRKDPGEDPRTALPRAIAYLRGLLAEERVQPVAAPPAGHYAGLANEKYFSEPMARRETEVAFLEGPAVDRAGVVYFTNTLEHILQWDPSQRKLTIFRDKSNQANGMRFDREGRLLACESKGRVTRTDMKTGKIAVLADQYQGKPLGAPNDVEVDGQGRIYFTSRLTNTGPTSGNVNAVYRIDPDGSIARILAAPAIDMPNGLATSPDDKIFYLIDADGRAERARRICAYDLKADGSVANERLLYDFFPGRSGDGMRVDAEGNLYVAAGLHRRRGTSETLDTRPGIHVIAPNGKLVAFIETPEDTITNCAFGGPDLRTLYITCGKLLLSVRTRIPGKASYRPDA